MTKEVEFTYIEMKNRDMELSVELLNGLVVRVIHNGMALPIHKEKANEEKGV